MAENDQSLDRLEKRLESLVKTQVDFQKEIIEIRREIAALRGPGRQAATHDPTAPPQPQPPEPLQRPQQSEPPPQQHPRVTPEPPPAQPPRASQEQQQVPPPPEREAQAPNFGYNTARIEEEHARRFKDKSDIEKFIGENLISKIGILVLIIGVGIGAKYAIDQGWITPLMRIVFGYAIGFGLLGVAVKLKAKYHNFSAVLLSGGMAIMYFITYFAYAIYELMPQSAAFVLMVMFTLFTVASALIYNRQIIAHIGLVGAYAVPFLLSNNSGNFAFLFTYMALVNAGILAISIKRNWKPLTYTSFVFTWLTFGGWYAFKYEDIHFTLALIFLGVFFATFHLITILQHRLFKEDHSSQEGLILTILNTVVLYGFCISLIEKNTAYSHYLTIFAFMAAMTLGLLIVSLRDYRRPLTYVSLVCTWVVFFSWCEAYYSHERHFYLGLVFSGIFFFIFYAAALVHSRMFPQMAAIENVAPILANSMTFFGVSYWMLDGRPEFAKWMGLFTIGHAFMHFIVAAVSSRVKNFPVEITYLLTGLVIIFITIAIPVQFDGTVVTVAWSAQAAVLFGIGRTKRVQIYEWFAYPVIFLASGSLLYEWAMLFELRDFNRLEKITPYPFAHSSFVSAIVYIAAMAVIYLINRNPQYEPPAELEDVRKLVGYTTATLALVALYNTFRAEITNYFEYVLARRMAGVDEGFPGDLSSLSLIWQINYTLAFFTILGAINFARVRSGIIAVVNGVLGPFTAFVFCVVGLIVLGELRWHYIAANSTFNYLALRYVSLFFVFAMFLLLHRFTRADWLYKYVGASALALMFDALFYPLLLVIVSSELISVMDLAGYTDSYKLGLSILWGVYALFLVVIGIYFKKRHLRIGAIVLFGITLAKLFLSDISQLSTIAKTAVFVSVGILMLIVSFLYTKYKNVIFGSDTEEEIPA